MRHAGLRPGDIVERLNGQALGDPSRDRAAFDAAVVAGTVSVEIERNGKRIIASLSLH